MEPPRTILNAISENGLVVIGVGKISDIFAGQGITESFPTDGNAEGMQRIAEQWERLEAGLIFVTLVDFDMLYGHRRDFTGYGQALEQFDQWLGEFMTKVLPADLVIVTADHGNDPTTPSTDHSREYVPILAYSPAAATRTNLGVRETLADMGQTIAQNFGAAIPHGTSFLREVTSSSSPEELAPQATARRS